MSMRRSSTEGENKRREKEIEESKLKGKMSAEERGEEEKEIDDEDERREEAISSTPPLQPNFKPKHISQDQLSKFRELHIRRLKLKSKFRNKLKDGTCRLNAKDLKHSDSIDSTRRIEDSSVTNNHDSVNFSAQQDNVGAQQAPKKRRKLYWGLDTKERWERKANM